MSDPTMTNEALKTYAIIPEIGDHPAEVVRAYSSQELLDLHKANALPDIFHFMHEGNLEIGYNPEAYVAYDVEQGRILEDDQPTFQPEIIEAAQIVEPQDKPFPVRNILFALAGTTVTLAACGEPMTGTIPTKQTGGEVTSVANATETVLPPTGAPTPTSTPEYIGEGVVGGKITNYEGGEGGPVHQRIEALGKRVDAVITTLSEAGKITADAVINTCWTQVNANHEVSNGVCAGLLVKPFGEGESVSPAGSWMIPALNPDLPGGFTMVDLPKGAAVMVWQNGQIVAKDAGGHIIATRDWDGEARMGESWVFGSESSTLTEAEQAELAKMKLGKPNSVEDFSKDSSQEVNYSNTKIFLDAVAKKYGNDGAPKTPVSTYDAQQLPDGLQRVIFVRNSADTESPWKILGSVTFTDGTHHDAMVVIAMRLPNNDSIYILANLDNLDSVSASDMNVLIQRANSIENESSFGLFMFINPDAQDINEVPKRIAQALGLTTPLPDFSNETMESAVRKARAGMWPD